MHLTIPTLPFNLFAIILLFGGWAFGRVFTRVRLPSVIGMVVFGILAGIVLHDSAPPVLAEISPFLKSFALIVILLRAGLGIQRRTLNRAGRAAVLMAVIPCLFEGIVLYFACQWLFDFPWYICGLTACMLSAVSPAVIVPSMLELRERRIGSRNDVPTIILAGASIDDVIAITIFTIFLGFSTGANTKVVTSLALVPLSLVAGIVSGAIFGAVLIHYFKRRHQTVRATEKTLILISATILLVQIGDYLHYAALTGVMTLGFIILEKSQEIAHELSQKLAKIWVFAEIILFVLIGFSLDPAVAVSAGGRGILLITIGLTGRSIGVLAATAGSHLSWRERLFCVIAYIPKATVQAALGGVALTYGLAEGKIILAIAVLSILLTAPLGLIGIRMSAARLLGTDIEIEIEAVSTERVDDRLTSTDNGV